MILRIFITECQVRAIMNINTETGDKNKKPVTKKVITYNTKLMIFFVLCIADFLWDFFKSKSVRNDLIHDPLRFIVFIPFVFTNICKS